MLSPKKFQRPSAYKPAKSLYIAKGVIIAGVMVHIMLTHLILRTVELLFPSFL